MEGGVSERQWREEERERRSREEDNRRQEEREQRSDELREAWRRRHPDKAERERRRQGKGGRV